MQSIFLQVERNPNLHLNSRVSQVTSRRPAKARTTVSSVILIHSFPSSQCRTVIGSPCNVTSFDIFSFPAVFSPLQTSSFDMPFLLHVLLLQKIKKEPATKLRSCPLRFKRRLGFLSSLTKIFTRLDSKCTEGVQEDSF